MLFGTVGVAPGSYTFQIPAGSKAQLLGPSCVTDTDGPYGYGLPSRHRYDKVNAWYRCQFLQPVTTLDCSAAGPNVSVGPSEGDAILDPYGTDSTLKGSLADAMTIGGVRLDLLGLVAGAVIGLGFLVTHIAKPKRR